MATTMSRPRARWPTALVLLAAAAGLSAPSLAKEPEKGKKPFALKSAAFANGSPIPVDHLGHEDNVSPHLTWEGAPNATESFVLIVDHAGEEGGGSAGRQTHWIVYDIPSSVTELREELSGGGTSDVGRLGMKDEAGQEPIVVDPMEGMMGMTGYEDPEIAQMRSMISGVVDASFEASMRAKEGTHSAGGTQWQGPVKEGALSFKLYALNERLTLPPGATREEVLGAMKGKVLAKTTLSAKVRPD